MPHYMYRYLLSVKQQYDSQRRYWMGQQFLIAPLVCGALHCSHELCHSFPMWCPHLWLLHVQDPVPTLRPQIVIADLGLHYTSP